MKLHLTGKSKKMAGVVLASALVIGSLGTIAAFAANNSDVVQKNTVMSAPISAAPSETAAAVQGAIQYSKDIYSRTDGSQNITLESWYNPATKDWRQDCMEYSADHQLINYQSIYLLNEGNDLVTIQRDQNGNAVSGTSLNRADQPAVFAKSNIKRDFNSIKEYFTNSNWTLVGTEQTSDGKVLNKISESYQSYINDTTQANMQLLMFIDQDTGLPVKEELYEDSTGQSRLFSSDAFEHQLVSDDGTIFKPDGVTLTQVHGPENTQGK